MTQAKYVLYFSVLPSLVFESTGSLLVLCSPEISLLTSVCSYLYTVPVLCVCVRRGDRYWDFLAFHLADVILIPFKRIFKTLL